MTALAISLAALIYVCAVSPAAAVLFARMVRLRDTEAPTQAAGRGRSDPRLRGARHLRAVK